MMDFNTFMNLITTLAVGALCWFIQRSIHKMDKSLESLGTRITNVEQMYNDLRADLPLLFVTREDYVRTLNAVDAKLDKQDSKLDRLLLKMGGDKNG